MTPESPLYLALGKLIATAAGVDWAAFDARLASAQTGWVVAHVYDHPSPGYSKEKSPFFRTRAATSCAINASRPFDSWRTASATRLSTYITST